MSDSSSLHTTVRPPVSSNVPVTLRMLFEDEQESPDLFRGPASDMLRSDIVQLSSLVHSPNRGRRAATISEDRLVDDLQTAKQSNFVFPLRTAAPRSKVKESTVDAMFEENDCPSSPKALKRERLPPLGPGIPMGAAPILKDETHQVPHDVFLIDEEADVVSIPDEHMDNMTVPHLSEPSTPFVTSKQLPPAFDRPMTSRKRSQSSAAETMSTALRDRNLSSSDDFHFPPTSSTSGPDSSIQSMVIDPQPFLQRRWSPTHLKSVSATSTTSSGAHQVTQSLDASIPRYTDTSGSLMMPPLITRARSATAASESPNQIPLSRKASISRLASLATTEINPMISAPLRPFARRDDRSSSPTDVHPLPGLKDVLKVRFVIQISDIRDIQNSLL